MTMQLSALGAHFIAKREACVLVPYLDGFLDPATKQEPRYSIGFGTLAKHGARTKPITVRKAFKFFRRGVIAREATVNRAMRIPPTEIPQHAFNAVFSLYYQGGTDGLLAVARWVREGKMEEAANEFLHWDTTASGEHREGLLNRRQLERAMFLKGDYGELNPIRLYDHDPHVNNTWIDYTVTERDLKGWTDTSPDEDDE